MKTPNAARLTTLVLLASLPNLPIAHAATATDTFAVTATVSATCSVTAADLSFGEYTGSGGTPVDGQTTISVTCTNGTPYHVALSDGDNGAHAPPLRSMKRPASADYINYDLYSDAGRTTRWGDDPTWVASSGVGSAQTLNVYGRIPANQNPAVGADYTDTISVTLTY